MARFVLRKSKSELDLDEYRNGAGFKVISFLRPVEAVGTPLTLTRGLLNLVPGEPITWKGRAGVQVLTGPFELNETGGKLPFGASFAKCLLSAGENDYELTVPKIDLPLIRLALGLESA
ncbi:hypothetical protein [Kutzneria chonburiensis]|uniref:Uncharacterized protein n=1 Tax=Kutzneria chonburiensis TaxID=1483604 RepID=A0ABV6N1N4_9PSEU|nr:hypothetical protein [Kutzneria chonburiensis]